MTDSERNKKMEIKKKKSKKKIIIPIIIGVVLLVGIIGIVGIVNSLSNAPKQVNVTHATEGELKQQVSVSGVIESDSSVTYYAPSSIKVSEIAEVGTQVKEGDLLLSFDEEEYNYALRLAEIQDQVAQNSYGSNKLTRSNAVAKYKKASDDVINYSNLVVVQQSIVDGLKAEVEKASKDAALNAAEIQTKINSKQWDITKKTNDMIAQGKTEAEIAAATAGLKKDLSELQSFLAQNSTQTKDQVSKAQQYEEAQLKLAEYKTELEKAKGQLELYESSSDPYASKNVDLSGEYETLRSHHDYAELLKYVNGLRADGNGVITQVGITEGATTTMGMGMITVASLDKIHVTVNVGKNDLKKLVEGQSATIKILDSEYTGKVRSISKIAMANGNGNKQITATVEIDNPDSSICLGMDGKVTILTKEVANCVMLPVEAVFTDNTGDFIYTVNAQNVLEKKYVTVGISSSDYVEIIDGVTLEDQVVTSIPAGIEEGMTVLPIDIEALNEKLGLTVGSEELAE